MICFSRPFSRTGSIGFRFCRQAAFIRWKSDALKLSKIDRHSYITQKQKRKLPEFLAVASLGVPATCFILALWQVDRKMWKDKLVEDMKLRTTIPAIELPLDLSERRHLEYRRFKVRGTFDHSRELYLTPRSLIVDSAFQKKHSFLIPSGMPEKPDLGAYVITPFKLADRDLTILVNRGWVPYEQKDPRTRAEGQIQGEVEIEGILRLKEDKPTYSPTVAHKNQDREFRYRDLAAMAEVANTSYVFLDATVESSVPGGPIGGQTQVNVKNDHMEYILTWLSIGLYTFYMWHRRFIRRLN